MSLSEVALLAHVDRSVVAHWRTRMARRDPFPEPLLRDAGQEFFRCADVTAWLQRTGLGNNRRVAEHAQAFHFAGRRVLTDDDLFAALTALLCLHALTGQIPATAGQILDAADERDPDDEFLYAELERAGTDLDALSTYAALLVRDEFDATEPFDALLHSRRTPGRPIGWRVADALADLVLDLAMAAADEAAFEEPALCLPYAQDVTLLRALPDWLDERPGVTVALFGARQDAEARLARRWLAAHGVRVSPLAARDGSALPPQAVLLARLGDRDREADLGWLNELTLQCSDQMRAVVVGSAAALTGPLRVARRGRPPASGVALTPAGEDRRLALQSGFTRAIMRLPAGLLPDNQAMRTAVWVLGPASDPADTYCIDVAAPLTRGASALAGDVASAMVGAAERRGHAVPGRFVRQAELVMNDGELVGHHVDARIAATRGVPNLLYDLVPAVTRAIENEWGLTVEPQPAPGIVQRMTLAEAVAAGHVRLIRGASLSESDLVPSPLVPVVTHARLLRVRDQLPGLSTEGLGGLPHLQVTQPGDIVFSTHGEVGLRLDEHGGVVAAAPARVLRCHVPTDAELEAYAKGRGDKPRPQRLVPGLLAAELSVAAAKSRDWRAWPVTLLPEGAVEGGLAVSAALIERQRQLEDALGVTNDLMSTLASALGAGLCSVTVERKSA